MSKIKTLQSNESIYKLSIKPIIQRPVKIAINEQGQEYYFEGYKYKGRKDVILVSHPCGIRCGVYAKYYRILSREEGYVPKPIK